MNTAENKRKYIYYNIIYFWVFVFYLWMAAQVPYTHDDWRWGIHAGMQQFIRAEVNSRYAGNLFVILMTRSKLLKVLIMGCVCFLLPYMTGQLLAHQNDLEDKQFERFVLSNIFFLTINRDIWTQTYSWVAGFANYNISAIFLLLWIKEVKRAYEKPLTRDGNSCVQLTAYFVIGIFGQLFLENLAIFHAFLGVFLCVTYLKKRNSIPARVVLMTSGAMIGLLIAFNNDLYRTLFATGSAYSGVRSIPLLGKRTIAEKIYMTALTGLRLTLGLYTKNIVIVVAILVLLSSLIWKIRHNKRYVYINCLFIIYFAIGHLYHVYKPVQAHWKQILDFCVTGCFVAVITSEIVYTFFLEQEKLKEYMAIWLCAPMLIVPLLFTGNTGQRLFLSSDVCLIVFSMMLFDEVIKQIKIPQKILLKNVSCLILLALLVFYGDIYNEIGKQTRLRESIIADGVAKDMKSIVLPQYPHKNYLHCANPTERFFEIDFKEFYGIPDDVEVIFEE